MSDGDGAVTIAVNVIWRSEFLDVRVARLFVGTIIFDFTQLEIHTFLPSMQWYAVPFLLRAYFLHNLF